MNRTICLLLVLKSCYAFSMSTYGPAEAGSCYTSMDTLLAKLEVIRTRRDPSRIGSLVTVAFAVKMKRETYFKNQRAFFREFRKQNGRDPDLKQSEDYAELLNFIAKNEPSITPTDKRFLEQAIRRQLDVKTIKDNYTGASAEAIAKNPTSQLNHEQLFKADGYSSIPLPIALIRQPFSSKANPRYAVRSPDNLLSMTYEELEGGRIRIESLRVLEKFKPAVAFSAVYDPLSNKMVLEKEDEGNGCQQACHNNLPGKVDLKARKVAEVKNNIRDQVAVSGEMKVLTEQDASHLETIIRLQETIGNADWSDIRPYVSEIE